MAMKIGGEYLLDKIAPRISKNWLKRLALQSRS